MARKLQRIDRERAESDMSRSIRSYCAGYTEGGKDAMRWCLQLTGDAAIQNEIMRRWPPKVEIEEDCPICGRSVGEE